MKRITPWWNSYPFIRLLIPFIAGIFLQTHIPLAIPPLIAAFLFLINLVVNYLPIYHQFRLRFIKGCWLNGILFCMGMLAAYVKDVRNSPLWFGQQSYQGLLARTISEPKYGKSGFYVNANVEKRYDQDKWETSKGKVRIRISSQEPIYTGTLICILKKPYQIVNRPGSNFDFKTYLANQNIYHQVDLNQHEILIIFGNGPPGGLITFLKKNILSVLDRQFPQLSERALAKALLVGYRDELDQSTVTAYTETGVIHVIAISGLHLGLIYAMLVSIARPFYGRRNARISINILIAVTLWVFTMICGASASVVRSAVMFTSLLIGDSLGSNNNTGNALASSAFLLLCYDPFLLRDIGFQLSYAAVASLLIYNRAVASLFRPENGILLHFWNSISTSIAAQILTTPLVLVHFHQFPLLFVLSNLVAVPVSGIILFLLIFLCLLQAFPFFSMVISTLVSWFIRFMNGQVERIASIPFSSWKEIEWTYTDLFFSYLLILLFTLFLKSKHPHALIYFLLTILTWLIARKYSL